MLYMYMDITYLVHNMYMYIVHVCICTHVQCNSWLSATTAWCHALPCLSFRPPLHVYHSWIVCIVSNTYCIYHVHKKSTALYRLSVVLLAAEHVQNMTTSALMTRDTDTDTIHVVRVRECWSISCHSYISSAPTRESSTDTKTAGVNRVSLRALRGIARTKVMCAQFYKYSYRQ